MKRLILPFAGIVALMAIVPVLAADQNPGVMQKMDIMPLAFTQNNGQWPDSILFRASASGATMWYTDGGVYYQFTRKVSRNGEPAGEGIGFPGPPDIRWSVKETGGTPVPDDRFGKDKDSLETMMLKASFVDANPGPHVRGEGLSQYKCNYFLGNDSTEWRTDVPNYGAVVFENIYAGIDLKYYGDGRKMEYDFIVSPGADPSQICIKYDGAKSLAVNDAGELVVETEWGKVTELTPLVYQLENGERRLIRGAYQLESDDMFSFELGDDYNPNLAVVVDPILSYSTYLGGGGDDFAIDFAVDDFGNVYLCGGTYSADFPIGNPYDASPNGDKDVFITKLDGDGDSLIYSTYLGGSGFEHGEGIAIDNSGNVFIAGSTNSTNFPIINAYNNNYNGGSWDVFIVRLSTGGNALVYSTYFGGSEYEDGADIAVDVLGNAYITGWTKSVDFPIANAFDDSYNGGEVDVYVAKINAAGATLLYSTFIGGSGDDFASEITIDTANNAYVTGWTNSSNFPMVNPAYGDYNGMDDAFIAKLNPGGNGLVYSTYLGGTDSDHGYGITIDSIGQAYVTGYTASSDFPIQNPFDGSYNGNSDAFVTKLTATGGGLVYSSYIGGGNSDEGYDIAVDGSGCIYVTGATYSSDFPMQNSYDDSYHGNCDAFVAKISAEGNSLVFGTYLGGGEGELGYQVAVGSPESIYVIGHTSSADFPTQMPYDGSFNGGNDAFLTKLNLNSSVVTNLADSGPGSLRAAIESANANPGRNIIGFSVSGTIVLASSLPYLTNDSTEILGAMSPGGVRSVIIDGGNSYGIGISGNHCLIRDIVLKYSGISISGQYNTVAGCYVDVDETGQQRATSTYCSAIVLSGRHNVIGGCSVADRNVLVPGGPYPGEESCIYMINGSDSCTIVNNYFDITAAGIAFTPAYSSKIGIYIGPMDSLYGIKIGDSTCGRNYFGGCSFAIVADMMRNSEIIGNVFGLAANLTDTIANNNAISVLLGSQNYIGKNIIVGCLHDGVYFSGWVSSSIVKGNTIAGNGGLGVGVLGQLITISQNLIYANGYLGIDLGADGVTANDVGDGDTGPNDLLNYPEIDSVVSRPDQSYDVYGRAAVDAEVELFVAHPANQPTKPADPSGHGEAYVYVGSGTCNGVGAFALTVPSSVGHFSVLTASATDPSGNTSEFSANFSLVPRPLIIVAYSPVNAIITDPDGLQFGKDSLGNDITGIPDGHYFITPNDSVVIDHPKPGNYTIGFVTEAGTPAGATYSAIIKIDGTDNATLVANGLVPSSGQMTNFNYGVEEGYHYINADANRDGIINIGDAVFIISYVFRGGPAPDPVYAADANCDRVVNVGDAVYIVGYMFRGGPEPCAFEP